MNQTYSFYNEYADKATRQLSYRICQQYTIILDTYNLAQYIKPATLRLVKSQTNMGTWNPNTRIISLNMKLFNDYSWQEIIEVLKHELAHQLQWEHFGYKLSSHDGAHGKLFQQACEMIAVAQWARGARAHIDPKIPTLEELCADTHSPWEIKIKKLLNLSQSSNEHEARLALEKARELSQKNHLWCLDHLDSHPQIHSHSISLNTKRRTAFHVFLAKILGEFFDVRPIFSYEWSTTRHCDLLVLDLIGHPKELLMADYVYHYLMNSFAQLWQQRKQYLLDQPTPPQSLRVAKSSYYQGLMNGFYSSLKNQHNTTDETAKTARTHPPTTTSQEASSLAKTATLAEQYNYLLDEFIKKKYPKSYTRTCRSRLRINLQEVKAGQKHGVGISVKQPIERQARKPQLISAK